MGEHGISLAIIFYYVEKCADNYGLENEFLEFSVIKKYFIIGSVPSLS